MENFKGTKKPWRIADDDPTFSALASDTYHQIKAGGGYHDDEVNAGFGIQGFMSIHDAKLIAAAPELLEAVCELVKCVVELEQHYDFDSDTIVEDARAAINKALGENQ